MTLKKDALDRYFSAEHLFRMFHELQKQQVVFQQTGGSHAAAIFNQKYQLLTSKKTLEDTMQLTNV